MSVLAAKQKEYQVKTAEAVALRDKIAEAVKENQPHEEDQKAFDALMDAAIPALEAEIKRLTRLEEAESKANENDPPAPKAAGFSPARVKDLSEFKSVGDLFVESAEYKAMVGKSRMPGTRLAVEAPMLPTQLKATFDLASTGLQTYINYAKGPILQPTERLTVRDLLAQGQTSLNSVPYIQETSYTNAATTVAEEGEKPEATFALQDEFAPVKKIAVMGKVTDEMWNDFPSLRSYINNRLRFMVEEREEAQLLSGAGTGSEITGILTASIQSQAKGADSVPVAIHKAITKIRVNNKTEPDGIVIHPNDWEAIRLLTDDNLQYYGGGPFTGAYGNGAIATDSLWGKRVVITSNITENTALVGSFKIGAQIFDREGVTVEATNTHEDDFAFNRMSIRVEERLALAIWQLNAFCKVTGI